MENREIKFRAFHEQSKQMFWFDIMWGNCTKGRQGGGYIGMVPFGMTRENSNSYDGNQTLVDPNDCHIMQFIGLEDRNNISIYEGDFLKHNDNIFQVVFSDTQKVILLRATIIKSKNGNTNWRGLSWCDNVKKYIEVIGNIHENPELL